MAKTVSVAASSVVKIWHEHGLAPHRWRRFKLSNDKVLIMSAKLNDVDPQAGLADVLARVADTPTTKLEQLLPWNWQSPKSLRDQAA